MNGIIVSLKKKFNQIALVVWVFPTGEVRSASSLTAKEQEWFSSQKPPTSFASQLLAVRYLQLKGWKIQTTRDWQEAEV